jgi:repressor LexA
MHKKQSFTSKQGQYLAFIYLYTKVNLQPPAETDIQRYFGTSAPTVHSMMVRLDELGLIAREQGKARTMRVLVEPNDLPFLE